MFFLYAWRVLKLLSGESLKQLRKSLKIVFYSSFFLRYRSVFQKGKDGVPKKRIEAFYFCKIHVFHLIVDIFGFLKYQCIAIYISMYPREYKYYQYIPFMNNEY